MRLTGCGEAREIFWGSINRQAMLGAWSSDKGPAGPFPGGARGSEDSSEEKHWLLLPILISLLMEKTPTRSSTLLP